MPQYFQKGNKINVGRTPWNKGLTTPPDVRLKQREAKLKNPPTWMLGKKRPDTSKRLKGIAPPYQAMFNSIETRMGGFWYGNIKYSTDAPYCEKFNDDLRERVRMFFGYRCFECGEAQTDKKLHVHHIHYNKKTCCDGSPHDMIPLCRSCHMKTNHHRNYWENHLTKLLYAYSPDGKCYFTTDEMQSYNMFVSTSQMQGVVV
jgi:hypothetical protein